MVLSKKQMTEEDIKLQFITPAILAKWNVQNITMETPVKQNVKFTDGKINIKGNIVSREKPKKADYILYINSGTPIAIVEAKDNNHSISHGLQQAKTYAEMLDVPFAFSSNGDGFAEHDYITGLEKQFSMDQFPSPQELIERFTAGKSITPAEQKVIDEPFYTGQNTYPPRYYQRNAVNRTLSAIAKGQNRILLCMATGTGKTYTAFQIVWRLLQTGLKKKVLYLADRNILVDQSIQQDFAPLQKVIHKVNFSKDDRTTVGSYQVYFSLYQQLAGETESEDEIESSEDCIKKFESLFSKDFFDLIIVDECHRGSAKADSNWRAILEYFSSATQIGMTATPKETKYVSNIDYFGEPVYSYSLKQGVDDGFLAPFRVINARTNICEGWRPTKGQKDKFGNEIEDRIYTNNDFDRNIILEDRRHQVAEEITKYLKQTDRMAKTIVFCATEEHAEAMRIELNNLNADMVAKNPDYVVRITGSDAYGKSKLDYFISVSSDYPVIATTSKLLSTGADCKMVKLIVLDEMISSMTEFKQIIGRGTRIREKEGKMYFTVMDFRNVTRLFADPEWDGPIEQHPGFGGEDGVTPVGPKGEDNGEDEKTNADNHVSGNPKPVVGRDGCKVEILGKTVSIYDASGKLLRQENIIDYTKSNIMDEYSTLDNFINKWSEAEKKVAISDLLKEHGIDLEMLKSDQNMSDVDDFDFICHVAFDKKPLTRRERAENVQKKDFLSKYSGVARQVLDALIEKYKDEGIYEIEEKSVLSSNAFKKFGSPANIAKAFGGKDMYFNAIKELEEELYNFAA